MDRNGPGIVELEPSEFGGGSPGRCVGVIGTLTPTAMEGLTSESFTAPNISVIAGGGVVDSLDSLFECDYQAVVDVGFGLPQDAEVTVDTVYPFVVPVFLPGETPAIPELVAVGDPSSADAITTSQRCSPPFHRFRSDAGNARLRAVSTAAIGRSQRTQVKCRCSRG